MRKVFLSLLLASAVATPALAQDNNSDQRPTRAERQQARSDRQAAREDSRPAREERQAPARSFERPSAPSFAPQSNGFQRPSAPDNRFVRQQTPQSDGNYAWQYQRQQVRDNRAAQQQLRQDRMDERQNLREQRQDLRQQNRVPPIMNTRPPVVSHVPQMGTQPPAPTTRRYNPAPQWNTHWRNDSRYDWRNYRNRHRSLFHLGFYYDPFGWGYQRYNIGWRLWPSYYGQNFWINDPWDYRLPYAPPGTQWVRYYNDAILVDMWSGQVVDVMYDFFW